MEVTESDIIFSEQALFGRINVFDDERINFIKNLDTIDVLAVPGSGKTTALLAKLIILSRKLDLIDGKGVLLLSHTNSAVDLIKKRIGHICPNIFRPPNYIGTVQSFINTFIAIPFFEHKYGFRPDHIDAELFNLKIRSAYENYFAPAGFSSAESSRAKYIINYYNLLEKYRLDFDDSEFFLTNEINGQRLTFSKPKRGNLQNYVDYSQYEKQRIMKWLTDFKTKFWRTYRILHFDDAYYFAKAYIHAHPRFKSILRHRFPFIFIDEMQDMESHQINVLDDIFYVQDNSNTFQRIGDKNQAIFSGNVKLTDDWIVRPVALPLSKSMRLSNLIAEKVQYFALNPIGIIGANEESAIPPRIIVYNDSSITHVIGRFAQVIRFYQESNLIPINPKYEFKVIGWRKFPGEDARLSIKSYHEAYNDEARKSKPVFNCLCDYLLSCYLTSFSAKFVTETLYKILLRVLELEGLNFNNRSYSKSSLIQNLRQNFSEFYCTFELSVLEFSKLIIKNELLETHEFVKNLIIRVVHILKGEGLSQTAQDFINENLSSFTQNGSSRAGFYEVHGVRIAIGSIHSAKGETHCSTLYLETYYHADGTRSFESQRLMSQFKGAPVLSNAGVRVKQSARMVYVGFSRPTHLLCVAIHIDRLLGHKEHLKNEGWIIDDLLVNN